jgi:hypothetical protein
MWAMASPQKLGGELGGELGDQVPCHPAPGVHINNHQTIVNSQVYSDNVDVHVPKLH